MTGFMCHVGLLMLCSAVLINRVAPMAHGSLDRDNRKSLESTRSLEQTSNFVKLKREKFYFICYMPQTVLCEYIISDDHAMRLVIL